MNRFKNAKKLVAGFSCRCCSELNKGLFVDVIFVEARNEEEEEEEEEERTSFVFEGDGKGGSGLDDNCEVDDGDDEDGDDELIHDNTQRSSGVGFAFSRSLSRANESRSISLPILKSSSNVLIISLASSLKTD